VPGDTTIVDLYIVFCCCDAFCSWCYSVGDSVIPLLFLLWRLFPNEGWNPWYLLLTWPTFYQVQALVGCLTHWLMLIHCCGSPITISWPVAVKAYHTGDTELTDWSYLSDDPWQNICGPTGLQWGQLYSLMAVVVVIRFPLQILLFCVHILHCSCEQATMEWVLTPRGVLICYSVLLFFCLFCWPLEEQICICSFGILRCWYSVVSFPCLLLYYTHSTIPILLLFYSDGIWSQCLFLCLQWRAYQWCENSDTLGLRYCVIDTFVSIIPSDVLILLFLLVVFSFIFCSTLMMMFVLG